MQKASSVPVVATPASIAAAKASAAHERLRLFNERGVVVDDDGCVVAVQHAEGVWSAFEAR